MPAYLYWGEDDYRMARATSALHQQVLDSAWLSFNYDKIEVIAGGDAAAQIIQGFNQAMTPPFGGGGRLVWLMNPNLSRPPTDAVLTELERTLPALPPTSHLLITCATKPDGRSKAIKLLQKHAQVQEFSPIPPWKTQLLEKAVNQVAQDVGIELTPDATTQLAESVGNDTRRLYSELEKLKLYQGTVSSSHSAPITAATVVLLVPATTQNSLQLAEAIRKGKTGAALALVAELLSLNEPSLKIVATLIRQFRTWLWVKLMLEAGERDERAIAQAAEVRNPKRIYFLQQDVKTLNSRSLRQILRTLLELDVSLKQGGEATSTLQTKVIEMCQYCNE